MHLEKDLKSVRVLREMRRMTFQSLILKLSEFWASRGCALQQPLDVEVGAGTMHPETFLRVLGPAHWNVAYVQPSRRPADGRFGENPNRLFKHHQFQVILKPAPDEVQQLYLDSLEACGINPRQHDIRFEEDNWESPTLGAWGIGWQVLFDGMEISQFTYFQQAGGLELAPISAELTYGLERIAMVLQRVDSVYDLEWAPGVKYAEVRLREEIEQSKYVFGQVEIPGVRVRRLSPRSVRALLPAATALLTAGSDLAGARAHAEVLAPVQHPRLEQQHRRDRADGVHPAHPSARHRRGEELRRRLTVRPEPRRRSPKRRRRTAASEADGPRTAARNRLRGDSRRLAAGADQPGRGNRRRAAARAPAAAGVAGRNLQHAPPPHRPHRPHPRAAERSRRAGQRPAGSASFKPDGSPTPAAAGFAAEAGVDVGALERVQTPKGEYLAFRKRQRGKATVDVLPDVLRDSLRSLQFPKAMRWDALLEDGRGELLFGRPIRWILYLYGGRVVPFTIARTAAAQTSQVQEVSTGAVTYGHRFLTTSGRAGRAIKVRSFDEYRARLLENFVILERAERHNKIARELDAKAQRLQGRVSRTVNHETGLLLEVPDLVEYPSVVAGTFAPEFLELPEEVLTTTLIHHQHYFPVEGDDGKLKNAFLAVINTEPDNERTIARNAERVVSARLRDARFFWEADRKIPLESRIDRLGTLLFHKKLGTYKEKAERIEQLAGVDRRRGARRRRGDGDAGRHRRAAGQGRSRHRHGPRVHRAARDDGRRLRSRRRAARGSVEGDLLPLPADRRRSRRAADPRAAGKGRGDLGGRVARRQARHHRRPVRRG